MAKKNQPVVEAQNEALAARIREALELPGKSVAGFATFAGITKQAVYKQKQTGKISRDNLNKLVEYTGKPHQFFFSRKPPVVRSADNDLDDAADMLEELMPPADFPMTQRERLDLARQLVRGYWRDGAPEIGKVIQFVRRVKGKHRKGR